MAKDKLVKADVTIHFKTGAQISGDFLEFIFAADSADIKSMMCDQEFVEGLRGREYSLINLAEVVFINVAEVKILYREGDTK